MMNNTLKTTVLFSALMGCMLGIGYLLNGMHGLGTALIMGLLFNGFAYWFSSSIILRMHNAQPLDAYQFPGIHAIVEELAHAMRIPKPTLWLINSNVANAFATGRSPKYAHVAVTTRIVELLDLQELRGVLAHELAHVYHRDILISSVAAVLVSALSFMVNQFKWRAIWGMDDSRDRRNNNFVVALVVAIVTPLIATLLQLALSRSREYHADESGAHICGDPLSLASALAKLHGYNDHTRYNPYDVMHKAEPLYIMNSAAPEVSSNILLNLFSTHPPVQDRIRRLEKMANLPH